MFLKKYIGTKSFYRSVFAIMLPMMAQQAITQLVSVADNVMIGRIGTEQMSGVAIVNELIFVFNLAIFGAISGASIFGAQFYGSNDLEGMRRCHRFKIYACAIFTAIAAVLLILFGEPLISAFIHDEADGLAVVLDKAATLSYAKEYLWIMLLGLVPFAVSQSYASTVKESGRTVLPMISSLFAVVINIALNYVLIFGKLGAPAMGVRGAAIATVISRFAEMIIIVGVTHVYSRRYHFIKGVYKVFSIPKALLRSLLIKGSPLILNEILWGVGTTLLHQLYSQRGLSAVSATNITNTVTNLFSVMFYAVGGAVSIIIGQNLGAGEIEKAKDNVRKLLFFDLAVCVITGSLLVAASPFIPTFYNTSNEIRELAAVLLAVNGALIPLQGLAHCIYFTVRSGGKTFITFLFDCVYTLCFIVPIVAILIYFTPFLLTVVFAIGQGLNIGKVIIGGILVKKGIWINNIVGTKET